MEHLSNYFHKLYALKIAQKGDKKVSISKAKGRVLGCDIKCKIAIPRFDNSAMDGFAIKLNSDNKPYSSYAIKGSIFAGDSKDYCLKNNEAIAITTGAKVPKNSDCVIQKEFVEIKGNELFLKAVPTKNQCIKFRGEDFQKGEILLKKGRVLSTQDIGILAMQGISKVCVKKKVKIIIFGSGNEIAPLNKILENNQIYDINSHFIRANFSHLNSKIIYGGVLSDNTKIIESSIKNAIKKADIVITSGGVSVGEKDYIHKITQSLGVEIIADSINIKPGRPVVLSKYHNKFILNLPGNPIGAFLQSYFCLPILIAKFSGINTIKSQSVESSNILLESLIKSREIPNAVDFKTSKKTAHIIFGNVKNNAFFAFNNAKYQGAQIAPLLKSEVFAIFDTSVESYEDSSNGIVIKKGDIIRIFPIKPNFYKN